MQTLTLCFVPSSITTEQFFPPLSPSTLVDAIKQKYIFKKIQNKKKQTHAYLISFSTGSQEGSCHPYGHRSEKSLLNLNQTGEKRKTPNVSGVNLNCCQSSDEALFIFASSRRVCLSPLAAAWMDRDRSTRTPRAAVALTMTNCSSPARRAPALFSTQGSPLSENQAGFMAAGEDGKHNKAQQLPGI